MFSSAPIRNDILLKEAMQIAMDYLQLTGQAKDYRQVEFRVANVILDALNQQGVRHRILLANRAIVAVERNQDTGYQPAVRVS